MPSAGDLCCINRWCPYQEAVHCASAALSTHTQACVDCRGFLAVACAHQMFLCAAAFGERVTIVPCCKATAQGEAVQHWSRSQCCSWLLQSLAPTHSSQPGQMQEEITQVRQRLPKHRRRPLVSGPATHLLMPPDLAPPPIVLASP